MSILSRYWGVIHSPLLYHLRFSSSLTLLYKTAICLSSLQRTPITNRPLQPLHSQSMILNGPLRHPCRRWRLILIPLQFRKVQCKCSDNRSQPFLLVNLLAPPSPLPTQYTTPIPLMYRHFLLLLIHRIRFDLCHTRIEAARGTGGLIQIDVDGFEGLQLLLFLEVVFEKSTASQLCLITHAFQGVEVTV